MKILFFVCSAFVTLSANAVDYTTVWYENFLDEANTGSFSSCAKPTYTDAGITLEDHAMQYMTFTEDTATQAINNNLVFRNSGWQMVKAYGLHQTNSWTNTAFAILNAETGDRITFTTNNTISGVLVSTSSDYSNLASKDASSTTTSYVFKVNTTDNIVFYAPTKDTYIQSIKVEREATTPSVYTQEYATDFKNISTEVADGTNATMDTALARSFRDDAKGNRTLAPIAAIDNTSVNQSLLFRNDATWQVKKGYGIRQSNGWNNVMVGVKGVKVGERVIFTVSDGYAVTVASSYTDYAQKDESTSTSTKLVFNIIKNTDDDYTTTSGYPAAAFTISKTGYNESIAVEKKKEVQNVTISSEAYATYVPTYTVDLEHTGVKYFYVSAININTIQLTQVTKVPVNTTVLIKGIADPYYIHTKTETVNSISSNQLQSSTGFIKPSSSEDYTYYVLAQPINEEIGFYPVTEGTTITASKWYIPRRRTS